ncbi:hypothetical protein MQE36_06900 [Zhouia spongiae]|uniref:Lipoprotein n=1 Tax=Zhouia spongiae TaxID=2202721 RepID=A0ABY3YQY2_9FLAO|nr:hypothetical protein [Zhouia spongiae]UNZ00064.1 hypothetical protein MQE36_06900 [Zhouia spongiae]
MNKNLVIVLISYLLMVSCGDGKRNQEANEVVEKEATRQKTVPEVTNVDDAVSEQLAEWNEWTVFNEEMLKFQKLRADNLSLSLDELIRLMKELDTSEFPEKINIPAIKSRLLVLRTFIYKARSISDDPGIYEELNDLQIKVVTAYNELKSQIKETYREKEYEKVLRTIDSIDNEIEQNKDDQNN